MKCEDFFKKISWEDIKETLPLACCVWEPEKLCILDWNKSAESIFGWTEDEVVGRNFFDFLIPEEEKEKMEEVVEKIISKKTQVFSLNKNLTREGETVFCEWHNVPLKDKKGKVNLILSFARDVIGIVKSEKIEKIHRSILDSTPNAIITVDEEKNILSWNKGAERMFGWLEDEVLGRKINLIIPEELCKLHQERFKKALIIRRSTRQTVEVPSFRKDGRKIHVKWTLSAWKEKEKLFFTAIGEDITKRKKQEKKIKKLYSLQKAVQKTNKILLRIKGVRKEAELFRRICSIVVEEVEDFKFSWIGVLEKETFRVKPLAWAGFEEGYLSSVEIRWDSSRHGMGPTGRAIKEKKPFVVNDIENNPLYSPWRKEALKRGYYSSAALPLSYKGKVIGTLNVYAGKKNSFTSEEVRFLKEVASDIAIGISSLRVQKELKETVKKLEKATKGIVFVLEKIVETKDPYTSGHQKKVAQLSRAIASRMNLSEKKIEGIYMAGLLHDIGKIYIPGDILTKPGKISPLEFEMIKAHPQAAFQLLKDVDFPWPIASLILQHHERLDGSGYPQGLKGDEIILGARILAVADVVEAMSSHRPYRPALGIDKALEEIEKNKGKLYDPDVVDACLSLFREKRFSFKE